MSLFTMTANGPMLSAGSAKTTETHSEAPCSNITQFSIEPTTAGLALSICYGMIVYSDYFSDLQNVSVV